MSSAVAPRFHNSQAGPQSVASRRRYSVAAARNEALAAEVASATAEIQATFPFRLPSLADSHRLRTALQEARKWNPDALPVRIVVANFSQPHFQRRGPPPPLAPPPPLPEEPPAQPVQPAKKPTREFLRRKDPNAAYRPRKLPATTTNAGGLRASASKLLSESKENFTRPVKPAARGGESMRPSRVARSRHLPSGGPADRRTSLKPAESGTFNRRDSRAGGSPHFETFLGTATDVLFPLPPVVSRRPSISSHQKIGEEIAAKVLRNLDTPARRLQREYCRRLAHELERRGEHVALAMLERAFIPPEEIYRSPPPIPSWMHVEKPVQRAESPSSGSSSGGSDTEDHVDDTRGRPPRRRSFYVKPAVAPRMSFSGSDSDLTKAQAPKINTWWTTAELKLIRARMRRLQHLRQLGDIVEGSTERMTSSAQSEAAGTGGVEISHRPTSQRAARVIQSGFGHGETGRVLASMPRATTPAIQSSYRDALKQKLHVATSAQQQKIPLRRPWTQQEPTSSVRPPHPPPSRLWTAEGGVSMRRNLSRPQSADPYRGRKTAPSPTIEPFFLPETRWRGRPGSAARSTFSDTGSDVIPRPVPMLAVPVRGRPIWEATVELP
ncbi:hypothetical protein HDU88_003656 [Geranomyces variabilis]|nr:hypothetical protein HDU88_003656 [Geranomyces variabilis]